MTPDRKVNEKIMEYLKGQVREIEALLRWPQVIKRVTFEVDLGFEDTPVPEDKIDSLVAEVESALQCAVEGVSQLADYVPDTSVGVSSIDRDDAEDEDE